MINVLFLINNLANGGAEKVLVNLVNNMDNEKFQITVRSLFNYGENRNRLHPHINYEYVFNKKFRGTKYLHLLPKKYIYNKVAYGNFDIIIVYLHGVLTKIVSTAPKSQKTIAYLHADMRNSNFLKSFSSPKKIRECFSSYDAIVSVSRNVHDSFQEATGITENTYVKYNTFDVEGIMNGAKKTIPSNIFEENKLNICSVGKLNSVKGYDRLLRIMLKLKNEGFDFKLTIIGEGPKRKEFETFILDNNLEKNIILVGFDSNPYKYIAKSDLFVCPSYSEGFSSVVVESLILGIPVLTTNCAGMSEILGDNNEFGIIVENDEDSLYKELKLIFNNNDIINYYKTKASERLSFFSTSKSVKEVEDLIYQIIKS